MCVTHTVSFSYPAILHELDKEHKLLLSSLRSVLHRRTLLFLISEYSFYQFILYHRQYSLAAPTSSVLYFAPTLGST
jgi:hypothetical protein